MARNNRSTVKPTRGRPRNTYRVCPHCLHRAKPRTRHHHRVLRGGITVLPSSNGGQPVIARRYTPVYAWLEPGDRALLHVLIRGPQGGTHYISLWLEDLDAILSTKTEKAVFFTLSPDVRLLETQGEEILRNAFPRSWLNALKRGYVKPSQDLTREYKSVLEKLK